MPLRDMSAGMLANIINQKPTLQIFLKVTLQSGAILGFTKFPEPLTYDGVTYLPGLNVTTIAGQHD